MRRAGRVTGSSRRPHAARFAKSVAAITFFVAAFGATAQPENTAWSASSNSTASANVVQPIALTLVNGGELDFGTFAPDPVNPETVTVNELGERSATGNITLVGGTAGEAAGFHVDGEDGLEFVVKLPPETGAVSLTGGPGPDMPLINWVSSVTSGSFPDFPFNFSVGATLEVGASQPAGTYSANFIVEVEYQ